LEAYTNFQSKKDPTQDLAQKPDYQTWLIYKKYSAAQLRSSVPQQFCVPYTYFHSNKRTKHFSGLISSLIGH
jgi:hypothetical protein